MPDEYGVTAEFQVFPRLVMARMALVAAVGGRPGGYCVSLPIETYGN
ncbi:hypothetical protein EV648_113270 [Kribbella sp. VKM Ac-2568]|nr:hypothetical protein EV648_113270 [Kribbella sp. VKM Ac-2568]